MRPTKRAEKVAATISKKPITDTWGQVVTAGADYSITCSFEVGTTQRFSDGQGNEFIPKTIVWFERRDGWLPVVGDNLAINGKTEQIKMVIIHDGSFLRQKDDIQVLTN